MVHKIDERSFSAQEAYQTAAENMKMNFDERTLEQCKDRIKQIANKGGLSCQCNIEKRDVKILKNDGFRAFKDRCPNPYSDSNETNPCYTIFWNKSYPDNQFFTET